MILGRAGSLFFFLGLAPFASAIKLSEKKPLVLRSADCTELQNYAKNFSLLFEDLSDKSSAPIPPCIPQKGIMGGIEFEMDLTSLLPEVYKNGTVANRSTCDGPNCLNNVLVAKGVSRILNYTDSNQMGTYIKSPMCEKLDKDVQPKNGDVTVITENSSAPEIVHAVVHLDSKLCFSKNGQYDKKPYAIYDCNQNLEHYKVKEDCRGAPNPSCKFYSESYKCKSFKDYYNSLPSSLKSGIDCMIKPLVRLENEISKGLSQNNSSCIPAATLAKESKELFERVHSYYHMGSQEFIKWLVYERADEIKDLSHYVKDKKGFKHGKAQ